MSSNRTQYPLVAAIVAAAIAESYLPAARAQQVEPPAPAAAEPTQKLDEVTVTGSRIKRTSDFNTATPTTVIDSTALDNMGVVNLGQALQEIPSNLSQFTPANTANSSFFTGSYLPDLRGLNPFFGSRTLTLVDTRRAVQTNQGDGFDLNFIPQVLVQRIDTVTGGASAAYGSGAISGVVNIILDRKLEGGRFNADGFETEHSDGKDRHVSAAYGHGLFDDRVHFVIGGEFEKQDSIGCQNARTWCSQDRGWYQSGTAGTAATYSVGTGLRTGIISPSGTFFPSSQYPLVTGTEPSSYQLSPDGTAVIPYSVGQVTYSDALASAPATATSTYLGGDGVPVNQYLNLMPNINRGVITAMVSAKITDDINFKADWNWGKVSSSTGVGANNTYANVSAFNYTLDPTTFAFNPTPVINNITSDNAYIQGNAALMAAVGDGAALSKVWSQVPLNIHTDTTVKRFTIGFDGKVPFSSSWTWDSYFEYGLTNREQLEPNEIRASSFAMALDSVLVNGVPECRVTAAGGLAGVMDPTNPYYNPNASYAFSHSLFSYGALSASSLANNAALAEGCVPINPFGTNSIPSSALAYSFGNLDEKLRYEQTVAALNASGEIFKGIGAGPFSAAVGFEWRQEVGKNDEVQSCLASDVGVTAADASADTCTLRSQDFAAQFGTPFAGQVTVDEVYGELNLPLAKDLPFAHAAEIDLAGRFSRYDNRQLLALEPDPTDPEQRALIPVSGLEATHNLVTWKASGFYEPIEGVRLRGSQSHDSRAADLRELYYGQQLSPFSEGGFGTCSHPGQAATSFDSCYWNLLGNVNLAPETSDTTTLGVVFTPPQVPGLQIAADWFHIRINNAISQANVSQVELACNSATAAACSQMKFNTDYYAQDATNAWQDCTVTAAACPAGAQQYTGAAAWAAGALNAEGINATSYNGAFYVEKGIDFSVSYTVALPDNSVLMFHTLATWAGEQKYQSYQGGPVLDILGQVGGLSILGDYTPAPRWSGNASVTWSKGIVSLTPNMRWVGGGTINALGLTPGANDVGFTSAGCTAGYAGLDLYQRVACGDPSATVYGYTLLPYNHVGSYFLFGLNGTISLADKGGFKNIQLFAQVNNLLNRAPPMASSPGSLFGSGTGGTNPILYDTIGMSTRLGFRLSF